MPGPFCQSRPGDERCIGFGIDYEALPRALREREAGLLALGFRCETCAAEQGRVLQTRAGLEERRRALLARAREGALGSALQREWTEFVEQEVSTRFAAQWRTLYGDVARPRYALCFCGSMGRKEGSPFSDIDAFLLVERETLDLQNRFGPVFRKMNQEFRMAEQAGLRFCDGGLTPELLVHDTRGLLRAIEIEAESARQLGTDNHLTAALEARFIEGDVEIYRGYARDVMAREGGASRQQTLEELGRFLGHRERHPPPTAETVQFDVKQTLYRPLQLSLTLLSGLHDIRDELDSKGRLARLLEGRHMSMAFANLYINALEDVCRLRVESHLHAGREEDAIEMATLDRGKKEGAIRAGQAVAAIWSALEALAARPDRRPGPFLSDRPLAPGWTSDAHGQCQVCDKAIGKGSRHHCRKCGKLVCDACSKTRAALTPTGAKERICDTCAPSVVKVWGAATRTPDAHGQCEVCAKRIGIMMRHHCRKCGKLVCGDCSKGTIQMGSSKIRVCDPCVAGG